MQRIFGSIDVVVVVVLVGQIMLTGAVMVTILGWIQHGDEMRNAWQHWRSHERVSRLKLEIHNQDRKEYACRCGRASAASSY